MTETYQKIKKIINGHLTDCLTMDDEALEAVSEVISNITSDILEVVKNESFSTLPKKKKKRAKKQSANLAFNKRFNAIFKQEQSPEEVTVTLISELPPEETNKRGNSNKDFIDFVNNHESIKDLLGSSVGLNELCKKIIPFLPENMHMFKMQSFVWSLVSSESRLDLKKLLPPEATVEVDEHAEEDDSGMVMENKRKSPRKPSAINEFKKRYHKIMKSADNVPEDVAVSLINLSDIPEKEEDFIEFIKSHSVISDILGQEINVNQLCQSMINVFEEDEKTGGLNTLQQQNYAWKLLNDESKAKLKELLPVKAEGQQKKRKKKKLSIVNDFNRRFGKILKKKLDEVPDEVEVTLIKELPMKQVKKNGSSNEEFLTFIQDREDISDMFGTTIGLNKLCNLMISYFIEVPKMHLFQQQSYTWNLVSLESKEMLKERLLASQRNTEDTVLSDDDEEEVKV